MVHGKGTTSTVTTDGKEAKQKNKKAKLTETDWEAGMSGKQWAKNCIGLNCKSTGDGLGFGNLRCNFCAADLFSIVNDCGSN